MDIEFVDYKNNRDSVKVTRLDDGGIELDSMMFEDSAAFTETLIYLSPEDVRRLRIFLTKS